MIPKTLQPRFGNRVSPRKSDRSDEDASGESEQIQSFGHAADEKRRTASESRRAKDSENNDSINRGSGRCAQRLDDADANAQNSAEKTDADKDESEETHRNASLFEYLVQNHYFGHAAPVMFGAPSASVHTG